MKHTSFHTTITNQKPHPSFTRSNFLKCTLFKIGHYEQVKMHTNLPQSHLAVQLFYNQTLTSRAEEILNYIFKPHYLLYQNKIDERPTGYKCYRSYSKLTLLKEKKNVLKLTKKKSSHIQAEKKISFLLLNIKCHNKASVGLDKEVLAGHDYDWKEVSKFILLKSTDIRFRMKNH